MFNISLDKNINRHRNILFKHFIKQDFLNDLEENYQKSEIRK